MKSRYFACGIGVNLWVPKRHCGRLNKGSLKRCLYPCFHPVFLWFANDMNFLSTKGRMSVGWRSQGGQGRLPVHFKGWVALGKDWQRVKFDSARRMLAMVNCTHSHLIMVCQDIWLEFV